MKLVEKLASKTVISKSGNSRKRPYGLFECPKCGQQVERMLDNGKKNLTCGAETCKDTHPIGGGRSVNDPIYNAFANMKVVCKAKGLNYPDEWVAFSGFVEDMSYNYMLNSKLTRKDLNKDFSVENCYWKLNDGSKAYVPKGILEIHGMHGTRPYSIWQNMKTRCSVPSHCSYKNYGGRGIQVCKEWKISFMAFWSDMEKGYSDDMTIDRINNDGNYSKENCRWLTLAENSGRSKAKITRQISVDTGETLKIWPNARQAGLELGIDPSSITKVCKGKKKSAGGFVWMN